MGFTNRFRSEGAAMSEWKNVSNWSKSDLERTPKSWEMVLGRFHLIVTRKHHLTGWFVDMGTLLNAWPLRSSEIEAAKKEALSLATNIFRDALAACFDRKAE
jgi:hypothetical protein